MYLKEEWNTNNNQFGYDGDYEELPYMYCESIEKSIKELYSLDKEHMEQAKKIIEKCEFTIELMEEEYCIDNILIEYYCILILAYKLFRLDEGNNELAGHVLQVKVLASCDDRIRYDEFEKMLFLLDDLIMNFDSVFYMGDFEFCSPMFYRYKVLVKCRRYVKTYNYELAYENYITLIKELLKKQTDYSDDNRVEREYIKWVKKQFVNLLKVAKIIDKLSYVEDEISLIFDDTYSLLSESDKKEFKLLLECEQCFERSDDKVEDIIYKLIDIFETEYIEEKDKRDNRNSRVYKLYMDFLVQVCEKSSYEAPFFKYILEKAVEIGLGELLNQTYGYNRNYNEFLAVAIFRLLSLDNEKIDLQKMESLRNELSKWKLGKAFMIEPILFWGTIDKQDNEEIRNMMNNLSSLYNKVLEIENYIKVKNYAQEKIAYYTSMQTLGYLLMDEGKNGIEKCRLSVMNVGYMNDPNEGKVINDVLEKNINCKTKEFYEFIDVDDKRIPKKTDKTLIFLKSFSDKVDRLTMWSEYGDKGNGVCIVLNGKTFQNAKNRINLLKDLEINTLSNEYDDYDLYKVLYWNKNDNEFYANGLDSAKISAKMKDIFSLLKNIFDAIDSSFFSASDKHLVISFLETVFAKLKYLIKFEEYKDENETRLIFQRKNVNSFKDIEEIPGDVSLKRKIYIHYPVQTMIDEIILGPKNMDGDEYTPYLLKRTLEINASNDFCTDICKSAIDYR